MMHPVMSQTPIRSTNSDSNKESNSSSRSKKSSVTEFIKRFIDSGSRVQNTFESTIGLYQKCVEISKEDGNKSPTDSLSVGKGHSRKLSHAKSMDSFNARKKSTASDPGVRYPTPCGLENLGNTVSKISIYFQYFQNFYFLQCYLNAILQCLRSTQPVWQFCDSCEGGRTKPPKNNIDLVPGMQILFINPPFFLSFIRSVYFMRSAFVYLINKMNSITNGSVSSSTLQKFKNAFIAHVPAYKGNL